MSLFRVSDHCDGTRFYNPASILPPGWRPRGLRAWDIWKWQRNRPPSDWPAWIDNPVPTGDPRQPPAAGAIQVTFIGHSTFLLRIARADGSVLTVMTDPIFSMRCSPVQWAGPRRVRAPGRRMADLPPIDVILVSHCHYDHMDLPSLRALARRGDDPLVVVPSGNARHLRRTGLRRVVELDWWDSVELADTRITATPARHAAARTPFDRNRSLWAGFMLRVAGPQGARQAFFAGDTAHGRHWGMIRERLDAPDLALLPVGAYDPRDLMASVHATPEEACAGFIELGARRGVGMHFGTFRLTDEPMDEPVRRLARAVVAAGLPPDAFTTLGHGECRDIACVQPAAADPR
ncbi:MBL fold metallo-hydrolase [Novacetimonas pomaceti]|uniref:Metallo-beta-lactamase domain-containing protein n=1 Tax=Novacetimonas pomaceti TaxID=2021998 RepID=A0A318QAD2_9PROT|nr:MBL fold metallo-hydrolase [Novacetimonas pomaceti]PYD75590.1 hypothetical protein CFR71_08415 [Novacetimonas pomaceti]